MRPRRARLLRKRQPQPLGFDSERATAVPRHREIDFRLAREICEGIAFLADRRVIGGREEGRRARSAPWASSPREALEDLPVLLHHRPQPGLELLVPPALGDQFVDGLTDRVGDRRLVGARDRFQFGGLLGRETKRHRLSAPWAAL